MLVSCSEDFLHTTPSSAVTEDTYFKNVDELESALNACYSIVNTYFAEYQIEYMAFPLFILGNIGSDDSEAGGGNPNSGIEWNTNEISMSKQTSNNFICGLFWEGNYCLVARCNLVIDKSVDLLNDPDQDADRIEQIVDQAKFLRAFGFYNLVTMFGDVPLPTHWINPDEFFFERASDSLVWAQIEKDLIDAKDLPMKSLSETGRVTHGAVHALLAKSYMWQKKFDQAIEAYTAIINSNEYSLVDNFGLIHRNNGEHCEESIFEFQHAVGVDGGDMTTWFGISRLPGDEGAGYGWNFDNPTSDLLSEFEPGDPRVLYTFIFEGDVFPYPYGTDGRYTVENAGSHTRYTNRKAWIPWDVRTSPGGWDLDLNWRYCRYAEVLLLYAEALNERDRSDEARTYLNRVRKRARQTPLTDPERLSTVWDSIYAGERLPDVLTIDPMELREAIYHEQRVELALEGHRRWILLRTNRFKESMERAKGDKGCTVEDYEKLLPIYWEEVQNSYGRIPQNPGYN